MQVGMDAVSVFRVHFVSKSGGHRGFATLPTRLEARARMTELRAKGYRVKLELLSRDRWNDA